MKPYIGSPSIGGVPQNVDSFSRAVTAVALHKLDNSGHDYLKTHNPDIIVQLEKMSFGWMLIPKAAVASKEHARDAAINLRLYAQYNTSPDTLPEDVTKEQFFSYCGSLATYLEEIVAPALLGYKTPHETKEAMITNGLEPEDESEISGVDTGEYQGDTEE